MTSSELIALRKDLGLTQAGMAKRMGLSLRAYQEIEKNTAGEVRNRHVAMAERVALSVAVQLKQPMLAPVGIRREALELARLITG